MEGEVLAIDTARFRGKRPPMLCLLFLFLLLSAITPPAAAAQTPDYMEAICTLGLMQGDGAALAPERTPTRSEAVVMLIRLLGLEEELGNTRPPSPFTDAGWAEPYLALAYERGLAKGISATVFGAAQPIDTGQYCALLLRALGYTDGANGQFFFAQARVFAGIVLGEALPDHPLTRAEMARLSWLALNARPYEKAATLASGLMARGVFTAAQFAAATASLSTLAAPQSTTVLIYMVGSDLESGQGRATKDLGEMLAAAESPNLRIVLQSGGTRDWKNEWMTDGKSQRFLVEGKTLSPLAPADDADMTSPATLTDFLRFGAEAYPAQRYLLVLWDHGEGTLGGFGRDELHENRTMRLHQLQTGIADAEVPLDMIVFDACLMATLETAYALRHCAPYLLAAEDLMPASGLYYTTWLNALAAQPTIQTPALAALIADSFAVHTQDQPQLQPTLSVIDSGRVEVAYEYAGALLLQAEEAGRLPGLDEARTMGARDGGYDQFDLVWLARQTDLPGRHAAAAAAQSAVVYLRCVRPDETLGLALYLPRDHKERYPLVRDDLTRCGLDKSYLAALDKLCGKQ